MFLFVFCLLLNAKFSLTLCVSQLLLEIFAVNTFAVKKFFFTFALNGFFLLSLLNLLLDVFWTKKQEILTKLIGVLKMHH